VCLPVFAGIQDRFDAGMINERARKLLMEGIRRSKQPSSSSQVQDVSYQRRDLLAAIQSFSSHHPRSRRNVSRLVRSAKRVAEQKKLQPRPQNDLHAASEAQLSICRSMGFKNEKLNQSLLLEYKGDVTKTVLALVEIDKIRA
jgi:hypothetical protein